METDDSDSDDMGLLNSRPKAYSMHVCTFYIHVCIGIKGDYVICMQKWQEILKRDFLPSTDNYASFGHCFVLFMALKKKLRIEICHQVSSVCVWVYIRARLCAQYVYYRQITLRIVGYHFSSHLTATLNLCWINLKVLVHGL